MKKKEVITILETPDFQTNSPCHYNRKSKENSVEKMNANIRGKVYSEGTY